MRYMTLTKSIILTAVAFLAIYITISSSVKASDISNADYYGTIIITNNSTTATAVSCNISGMNTANLISSGFLNSTANNCAIQSSSGADVAFMPSINNSYSWMLWVDSIGDNQILTDTFYTSSASGGKICYFPGNAGMNTEDSPSLEISTGSSSNGSVEGKAWINTDNGTGKNIFHKLGSFLVEVSDNVSGNITAANITGALSSTFVLPTSYNDPDSAWTTETLAYDEVTGTNAQDAAVPAGGWSSFLEFYFDEVYSGHVKYYVNVVTDPANAEIDIDYYDGSWHNGFSGVFTASTWQTKSLGSYNVITGIRVRLKNTAGGAQNANIYEVAIDQADEIPSASVSIVSVASGEHTVNMTASGPLFGLGVDIDSNTAVPQTSNLTFNIPLHHQDMQKGTLTSKDANGYTLTATGVTWGNYGAVFDGTDDRLTLASPLATITEASDFSIATWFKSGDDDGNVVSNTQNANDRVAIAFETGQIRSGVYNGTYNSESYDSALQDTWYFAVLTYDTDTHNSDLYVNTSHATGTTNPSVISTVAFRIGERTDGTHDFKGIIGEVQVFDKTLSQSEITTLYNATKWRYPGHGNITDASNTYFTYAVGSFPNTPSSLVSCVSSVTPYVEYQKISVNGTLQQHIEWEYAETFTDLSGNGHDATPSFRSTSSDSDVSAALTLFAPVSQPTAPQFAVGGDNDFVTTNVTMSDNYSTGNVTLSYPGSAIITVLSDATATPSQLPVNIIASFLILMASIMFSAFIRAHGSASAFVKVLILGAGFGIARALGIYDDFTLLVFIIIATAILLISNQRRLA